MAVAGTFCINFKYAGKKNGQKMMPTAPAHQL